MSRLVLRAGEALLCVTFVANVTRAELEEASARAEERVVNAGLFENTEPDNRSLLFEGGGYVRGVTFIGFVPQTGDPGLSATYIELGLQPTLRLHGVGAAFADLRVRYGQELDRYGLIVDLREAYAHFDWGPLELRLGKQIVAWGKADAFNPTNNISPLDWRTRSPIEDDRRIGTVGARTHLIFSPFRLEGVWMPLYEPTIYPNLGFDSFVTLGTPLFPPVFESGLGALRIHLELKRIEASVSYLHGQAPLPGLDLESFAVGEEAAVVLRRRSFGQHVVGADFSTVLGGWLGLRGEGALRSPVDRANHPWSAKPDLQWVIGVDRTWGDVMVVAQYLGRYNFEYEPKRFVPPGGDALLRQLDPSSAVDVAVAASRIEDQVFNANRMLFSQLFEHEHLGSLRFEWRAPQSEFTLSALMLVNVTTREWAAFPKIGYAMGEGFTIYAGGEIYSGPEGTLFHQIEHELSAGYLELRLAR